MIIPVLFALAALWVKKSGEYCTPENCHCGCAGESKASSPFPFAPRKVWPVVGDDGSLTTATRVAPIQPGVQRIPEPFAPSTPALISYRLPGGQIEERLPGSPVPERFKEGLSNRSCFPEMCLPNWGGGMTWFERYGFPREECCE